MTTQAESPTPKRRTTTALKKRKTHIEKLDKPSRLQEMHAGDFSIDPRVQRELNELRVEQMAADFRPDSLGLLTASERVDGRIYILDGMHRMVAARRANYEDTMATRIFTGLTLAEEAGLFLTLNQTRQVQAVDKFRARITLGDRVAVNINKILHMYGLSVNMSAAQQPNSVSAIVTLEKVYRGAGVRTDGEYSDLVDKVIGTIQRTQDTTEKQTVYSRVMIEGLGIFWATFGKQIDRERLDFAMGTMTPAQLAIRARGRREAKGGTLGENAAEVIWSAYNNRLRVGKLPDFNKVEPMANLDPTTDELYVDPAQYVRETVDA